MAAGPRRPVHIGGLRSSPTAMARDGDAVGAAVGGITAAAVTRQQRGAHTPRLGGGYGVGQMGLLRVAPTIGANSVASDLSLLHSARL